MALPPINSNMPQLPPLQRPESPRAMFSALAIASSGLSAQRLRMDVIAQNLANAETTRTAQGGPYQRRVVNLEAIDPNRMTTSTDTSANGTAATGVAGANGVAGVAPAASTS